MPRDFIHINEDMTVSLTLKDNLGDTINPQTGLRRVEIFLFHKQTGKEIARYHTVDGSDPLMDGWLEAEISGNNILVYINGEDTKGFDPGEIWAQIDAITDNANFTDGEERHPAETKLLDLRNAKY